MRIPFQFPLLAKVLSWLFLHLAILGLCFFLFVRWQLGLGLDSLLSGSAGERLEAFGDSVVAEIVDLPQEDWNEAIQSFGARKKVRAAIFDPADPEAFPMPVPSNVLARLRSSAPPQHLGRGPMDRGPGRPPGPLERPGMGGPGHGPDDLPPPHLDLEPGPMDDEQGTGLLAKSRPDFLLRADNGDGYWAGVLLHLPAAKTMEREPTLLLIRADRLDGSGMFFEFKPWLWGGLAVLILSLAFWTPFVWGIARYVRRLTRAAERIASGQFQLSLPPRGNDELGDLGRTIETMAARLDHLITGQKRFLGDAAHELCAPLARIRTGLGILEMKIADEDSQAVASIEADTAELAALVNEILAFSRAGNRSPSCQALNVKSLLDETVAREAPVNSVHVSAPADLQVMADPLLLGRAIGNLVRNVSIHAGPDAKVSITAGELGNMVAIRVTDDGPGVPPDELPRLFEPFYRLDRSRSRETGGSGLGLAIVRTAVESCAGEAVASIAEGGGFCVTLSLPKAGGGATVNLTP